MTNETSIRGMALSANDLAIDALIDTQVVLQLLVKHNIVSPKEVRDMRAYISSQPKYKKIKDAITQSLNEVDELKKFEDLFAKSLQPGGREKLTQEEKEYLLKVLNEYKNSTK